MVVSTVKWLSKCATMLRYTHIFPILFILSFVLFILFFFGTLVKFTLVVLKSFVIICIMKTGDAAKCVVQKATDILWHFLEPSPNSKESGWKTNYYSRYFLCDFVNLRQNAKELFKKQLLKWRHLKPFLESSLNSEGIQNEDSNSKRRSKERNLKAAIYFGETKHHLRYNKTKFVQPVISTARR